MTKIIDRAQAQREIVRLVGKGKPVRLEAHESVSSPERREKAAAEYERVKTEIERIDARVQEIIAAHPEIQQLYARRKELRPLKEQLNWARHYRKFEAMAGLCGIGWNILGSGDTWAEVIEKARAYMERERGAK